MNEKTMWWMISVGRDSSVGGGSIVETPTGEECGPGVWSWCVDAERRGRECMRDVGEKKMKTLLVCLRSGCEVGGRRVCAGRGK